VDPTADPRMTIDMRAVNLRTEPMPWPMPVLEVAMGALEGSTCFFRPRLIPWVLATATAS
jgi:hypothetical protein